MELEEKIQHFYEETILDVNEKSKQELAEYRELLEQEFASYERETRNNFDSLSRTAPEALKKSCRQEISKVTLTQKYMLAQKEAEYTEKVFARVQEKLEDFKETDEYPALLRKYIRDAIDFAQEDALTIYLDMDDARFQQEFSEEFGREIKVSEYSFGGGMRALIPAKNILIENSFSTNLQEQLRSFVINV